MRTFVFIISGLVLISGLTGCGKKQQALEEMQEPMSMEALSKVPAEGQPAGEAKALPTQAPEAVSSAVPQTPVAAEQLSLAASTTTKPTNQEIQTALKNSGFYAGEVDGKIGHKTKMAIEEFQKANNLKPDGKVGPKTWAALSKYLTLIPAETKPKKKR